MASSKETEMIRSITNTWKTISADLSLTEERPYGSPEICAKTGLHAPAAGRMQRFFRGLGLLSYHSQYGAGFKGGQRVFTKLEKSMDEGLTIIYKHFDAGRSYSWFEVGNPGGSPARAYTKNKADAVVIASEKSKEEVRAIAGPEPVSPLKTAFQPLRKNEPEALLEAARQYANRISMVTEHINELSRLGVEVDTDMVMKGIKMTSDPELEAIGRILPVIDRIDRVNNRLSGSVGALKDEIANLRHQVEPLRKEVASLQAANKRLSERNVALSTPSTSQASTQA